MFRESAPPRADVEHAPAGPDAAGLDGCIQFAADGAFERLVVVFEVTVRVTAVSLVEKKQVEIGIAVVVLAYPLFVAVYLAEEQSLPVRGPDINERMSVSEPCAKVKRSHQVAFDRDVAIQVSFPDSLLVQGAELRRASPVMDRDSEFDLEGKWRVMRAYEIPK